MAPSTQPSARYFLRCPTIIAGALLCCVGLGNWGAGWIKLIEYDRLAAETRTPQLDGILLSTGFTFTDVRESRERHNIALAKVQYYNVVVAAGQVLLLVGVVMLLVGYLRLRFTAVSSLQNRTLLDSTH
jgi:hypothetical protein